jgi:hypothetical protein
LQAEENMKTVRITMEGGVIQDVACPKGVKVIVKDYDTEGYDTEGVEGQSLKQDEHGDDYIEIIWE